MTHMMGSFGGYWALLGWYTPGDIDMDELYSSWACVSILDISGMCLSLMTWVLLWNDIWSTATLILATSLICTSLLIKEELSSNKEGAQLG